MNLPVIRNRRPPFLSAVWRNVALLSWAVPDEVLEPLLPSGLVLDRWDGSAYFSLVGLWFDDIRICGLPSPVRRYEEVNLRFYVRKRTQTNRFLPGVVFIRQLVPHRTTARVARWRYGEPFKFVPMCHRFDTSCPAGSPNQDRVAYGWQHDGRHQGFWIASDEAPCDPPLGSLDEFLTARYWGYNGNPGRPTRAYKLTRPAWTTRRASAWGVECDSRGPFGSTFGRVMTERPASALLASGSHVQVHRPTKLEDLAD